MDAIPYGRQTITQADLEAVQAALTSDYLTQGPRITEFEAAFANYVGSRFAVAVSNGTAALHLSCLALDVASGCKVLTTPITFAASANCVLYCGGSVEFVDIRPEDATLDLDLLEQMLEVSPPGTYQGVVVVDFAGSPVNLERCREIADRHRLWILEDACHAPGAAFQDRQGVYQTCGNGAYADLAAFSFHPVKHIACGEGGMVTTNNEELYRKVLRLRTHGITKNPAEMSADPEGGWYYEMQDLGFNYRLTDFQAALGLSQLARADQGLARRRQLAARYDAAFEGSLVRPLKPGGQLKHAYHLYIINIPDRRGLYDHLHSRKIFAQVHYIPVHQMPFYQALGQPVQCPRAEEYYKGCLSLPMYPALTDAQQDRVIEAVLGYHSS